ncbi:hypothetical protein TNCV_2540761 [Trichonephila clavipes]|nr:hypothetical protein TNCV_2540761 [Trichonephila clavipes]
MQPKPSSLRTHAHQSKSRTETEKGETLEKKLGTLEQKKREAAKENAREVGKPIDENSACVEVGNPSTKIPPV